MRSTIARKMRQRQRQIARPRLHTFLNWITYHALQPVAGERFESTPIARAYELVRDAVIDAADRGAFLFFGIRNAAELGTPIVELVKITEDGVVVLHAAPLIDHIFAAGDRLDGWKSPDDLTLDELER